MNEAELSRIFNAWAFRTADLAHELSLRAQSLTDRFTAYGLFDALLIAARTVVGGGTETRVEARRPGTRIEVDAQRPASADPALHELVLGWLAETYATQGALDSQGGRLARATVDALSSAAQLVELRLRGYVLWVSQDEAPMAIDRPVADGGPGDPEDTWPTCQEKEHSPLWSGRLCWSPASYRCCTCGKRLCSSHARFLEDGSCRCVACRPDEPGRS